MFTTKLLPALVITVFSANTLFAAPPSAASQPMTSETIASPETDMCHCKHDNMKRFNTLQLTDAQKNQVNAIRDKAKASLETSKNELKNIRSQINQLITTNPIDQAKLDTLIHQKTSILANIMKVRTMAKNQIYNVLNPQQQQQFKEIIAQPPHRCH